MKRGNFLRVRNSALGIALTCLLSVPAAQGASGIAWNAPTEIALGRGERGEWRQNESDWDYLDDPTVALQPNGSSAVAWVDQRRKDVFFQVYAENGKPRLNQPVNVSRTPAVFSWLPRVALAPDGPNDIYVLWQEIVFSGGSHGGDIFFARSEDGGATFGEPLNLSTSVGGDGKGRINANTWDNGSLDIAVAPDGTILTAWTEYHGALWFSRSRDRGASFSKPFRVAGDDTFPTRAPALAVGPNGNVYLTWTHGEDAGADIRIARSEDGGRTFGKSKVVAETNDYSDAPKVAIGRDGTLHVVFGERSERTWRRADIRYTRSTDRGDSFAPPRVISALQPGGATLAAFPSIELNDRGDVFAIWELFRGPTSGAKGLAAVVSRDGGQTFSAPAIVPGSADPAGGANGSNQGKLTRKLAVNSAGQIALVNSALSRGESSRAWLMLGRLSDR